MKKSVAFTIIILITIYIFFYLSPNQNIRKPIISKIDLCKDSSQPAEFIRDINGLSVYIGISSEDFMSKLSRKDRDDIKISGTLQIVSEHGMSIFSENFRQAEIRSNVSRTIEGRKYHLQLINIGLIKKTSSSNEKYTIKLTSECNNQELKGVMSYIFIEGYNPKI